MCKKKPKTVTTIQGNRSTGFSWKWTFLMLTTWDWWIDVILEETMLLNCCVFYLCGTLDKKAGRWNVEDVVDNYRCSENWRQICSLVENVETEGESADLVSRLPLLTCKERVGQEGWLVVYWRSSRFLFKRISSVRFSVVPRAVLDWFDGCFCIIWARHHIKDLFGQFLNVLDPMTRQTSNVLIKCISHARLS